MNILEVLLIIAFVQTFEAGECHVAKCLKQIALQYFKSGETLVIVNGCREEQINERQLQRKFLTTSGLSDPYPAESDLFSSTMEELHRLEGWPFLVCNTCYEVKQGTRRKHSSYILLLRTPDFIRETRNQLTALKDLPEWNPRANFVVILLRNQAILWTRF